MSYALTLMLAAIAAMFYVGATYVLKIWNQLPPAVAMFSALALLSLACLAELEVLRRARFGDVVVLVIAFEVTLALVVSHLVLSEVYTGRDLVGLAVIALGLGILTWEGAGRAVDTQTAGAAPEPAAATPAEAAAASPFRLARVADTRAPLILTVADRVPAGSH